MTETNEFDLDIEVDPELVTLDECEQGNDDDYDGSAVEDVEYDNSQFELPETAEFAEDDEDD